MNLSCVQPSRVPARRDSRRRSRATIAALAVALLAGCDGNNSTTSTAASQLPTPTFGSLEIPDPSGSNNWTTYSTNSPPPKVLPVRGRAVRIYFYAPGGSVFAVSLREMPPTPSMSAVTTPLIQNYGTPAPPADGYFQVLSENPSSSQAIYHMYVRAPTSLMLNPNNYDILVANQSLSTNATDSSPMVVSLRAKPVFTVTVSVTGNGKVTSSPGGITCGTSPSGSSLTDCSFTFGPGQVNLAAQGNTPGSITFSGWTGNCAGMGQTCALMLDGTAGMVAGASFGGGSSAPGSTCSTAPAISGWRWIGVPGCGPIDTLPGVTLQCDANGYFCCSTVGPQDTPSSRCSGQKETPADCRNQPNMGLNARLIQPGGCYEVDTFP